MKRSVLRNQKGFTLIEVITVLVILGILAAVAVPKYMALTDDAKKMAAMGQVAEIKGALNAAWGKVFIKDTIFPTVDDNGLGKVLGNFGTRNATIGIAPDNWTHTIANTANAGQFNVNVVSRNGDLLYTNSGLWTMPSNTP